MSAVKRLREARSFRPRKENMDFETQTVMSRLKDVKLDGGSPQKSTHNVPRIRGNNSLPEKQHRPVLRDHTNVRSGPVTGKSILIKPGTTRNVQTTTTVTIKKIDSDKNVGEKSDKVPVSKLVRPNTMKFTPGFKKSRSLARAVFHVQAPSREMLYGDGPDLLPTDLDDPTVSIRNLMTKLPKDVEDIDNDRTNIYHCPEYAQDIYDYLQAVEMQTTFPDDYLEDGDCSANCRSILVDWIIQVQVHLEMSQQTLHMAVALIDRFLNLKNVSTNVVQLLGITCLLVASKFVERFPPEISTLCRLTDNTYNKKQVLSMERMILKVLDFNLNIPDGTVFLGRFIRIEKSTSTKDIENLAKYLLDMSLVAVQFVHYVPSLITAAALYVARKVFGVEKSWTKALSYYTKYSEMDISECAKNFAKMLIKAPTSRHQGAREKYSSNRMYGAISLHPFLSDKPIVRKVAGETTV
ncbi:hypothetical protein ScPMuIL_013557 [Solemya velum]